MAMLEIRGVHKSFHTYAKPGVHLGIFGRAPKPTSSLDVLRGVDLTVEKGDVVAILGPSGSGKTTLLCETLRQLADKRPCAVIEGDQQTSADADRIRATGVPAVQINTGKGCHLDAKMVHDACHQLPANEGGILFIENVGNLVCPASFDLGEKYKVAILSVTEGEEKPMK